MKPFKKVITLLVIVFTSTIVRGQDESFKDLYLKGKWKASCPVEIQNNATMKYCQLCPFVVNSLKEGQIKEIEINFLSDSIAFNQNGKMSTVPYTRNKDTHAIGFTLDNKQYSFRMFLDDDRRILVDSDGMLVVLEKVTQ